MQHSASYKPLLYSTTMRNPERAKDFLHLLLRFDGQTLTDDIVEQYERALFEIGLYKPQQRTESVRSKWKDLKSGEISNVALTPEETKAVYDLNDPAKNKNIGGHKEAGFVKGWQSRFHTQLMMLRLLGFVYYDMGEPIHFSPAGRMLAKCVRITIDDNGNVQHTVLHPEHEQMAFANAMAKQQRCNPFIQELNDNIPLILLLQTIKLLNADSDYNDAGIAYKELPLLIFWKDNDAKALYQRIKQLRQQYGYNPSDEVIAEICTKEILGKFKDFQLKSIVSEYPDDFIRKMRITGLVTMRGGGRFIDINHNEDKKVEYIIAHYANYRKYTDKREYFDYAAASDDYLLNTAPQATPQTAATKHIARWAGTYSWQQIKAELTHLATRSPSKDNVLQFIPAPARLEFLTAVAIKARLPHVEVIPHFPCDDEGLPTSTAGGNSPDIECREYPNAVLVEVTMANGRQQTVMEVWPIDRHLAEYKEKVNDNAQCVFVAPSIFADSIMQIDFVKEKYARVIRPYPIPDFLAFLEQATTLYQ